MKDPLIELAVEEGLLESKSDKDAGHWWVPTRVDWGALPRQGFKLHVSATLLSAESVLRKCLPYLKSKACCFKFAHSLRFLEELNEGRHGYSQVGKMLTTYPTTPEEAVEMGEELHRLVGPLAGPTIVSDLPVFTGSVVHYRYGLFDPNASDLITPDGGRVPDARGPGTAVPDWVVNPFKVATPVADGLLNDYVVLRALHQRPKGGVFLALSKSDRTIKVIKEGRRHGEVNHLGQDGYSRVEAEAEVYHQFGGGRSLPSYVEVRKTDSQCLLILERVLGQSIKERLLGEKDSSPAEVKRLALAIFDEFLYLKSEGLILVDLAPGNIIVEPDGSIRFVDLEHVARPEEEIQWEWGTAGFVPKIQSDHDPLVSRVCFAMSAMTALLAFPKLYRAMRDEKGNDIPVLDLLQRQQVDKVWMRWLHEGLECRFSSFGEFRRRLIGLPVESYSGRHRDE